MLSGSVFDTLSDWLQGALGACTGAAPSTTNASRAGMPRALVAD